MSKNPSFGFRCVRIPPSSTIETKKDVIEEIIRTPAISNISCVLLRNKKRQEQKNNKKL
jgi:hypothetical protein